VSRIATVVDGATPARTDRRTAGRTCADCDLPVRAATHGSAPGSGGRPPRVEAPTEVGERRVKGAEGSSRAPIKALPFPVSCRRGVAAAVTVALPERATEPWTPPFAGLPPHRPLSMPLPS
jgi:hypothetical protein